MTEFACFHLFCAVDFEEQYGSWGKKKNWRKGGTARKTATRKSMGAAGSAMDLSIRSRARPLIYQRVHMPESHQRLGSAHVGKVLDVLARTVHHKSDDLI